MDKRFARKSGLMAGVILIQITPGDIWKSAEYYCRRLAKLTRKPQCSQVCLYGMGAPQHLPRKEFYLSYPLHMESLKQPPVPTDCRR